MQHFVKIDIDSHSHDLNRLSTRKEIKYFPMILNYLNVDFR